MRPNPRDTAVWALADREGNVTLRLEALLGRVGMPAADQGLARELALGTHRRRATIDAILRAFMERPDHHPPGMLSNILVVAAYQILFLDRIPQHAAVFEAVEQASRQHHRRQSGMVNGILRSLCRGLTQRQEGTPPMARDIVPIDPQTYCRIDRDVFPSPAEDPAGYLAAAHSLPRGLAERWLSNLGGLEKAAEIAAQTNVRAPLVLRVNRLRTDVPGVLAKLAEQGVPAVAHANGLSVVLTDRTGPSGTGVFETGLAQVQDASATAVGLACCVKAGMTVLDFCAAPGTKTTHLAELMDNRGAITAADVSAEKLQRIDDNCQRLGISIVKTMLAEQVGGLTPESFDVVLVDAPCTNTGVLARRAEARWRFSREAMSKIIRDQHAILALASGFVRPGGRLVYSTCSIEPEECQQSARMFAGQQSRFRMIEQKLTLPAGAADPASWSDGGYYAVFQR